MSKPNVKSSRVLDVVSCPPPKQNESIEGITFWVCVFVIPTPRPLLKRQQGGMVLSLSMRLPIVPSVYPSECLSRA